MADMRLNWAQLLDEALTAPGDMAGTYDRFHDYSLINMLLFRQQGVHEPVASYSRWQALGRQVLRGARAKEVIMPVLVPDERAPAAELGAPNAEARAEQQERIARLIGFKVVRAVFALSDTTGPDLPPSPTPGWDYAAALAKLGIREVPFDEVNGNVQGYSHGTDIAINPLAVRPAKTRFHELGHVILGHTLPHSLGDYATHRGIKEFQAEAVAYLAMNELGQLDEEAAVVSRGYIQHWLQDERPPDKAIQQAFTAADCILRAGRLAVGSSVAPS